MEKAKLCARKSVSNYHGIDNRRSDNERVESQPARSDFGLSGGLGEGKQGEVWEDTRDESRARGSIIRRMTEKKKKKRSEK